MRKFIVITSIFEPTEAVASFSRMKDYKLIVVGDKKTPAHWHYGNVDFLPVEEHGVTAPFLSEVLPYNHYCRKMIGYLKAIKEGADYIVDTDDDNIPKENWCFPDFSGSFSMLPEEQGFVNVYQLYTDQKIWPRGLPLHMIREKRDLASMLTVGKANVGIWQGLADEDPDVDAIYRLTSDTPCYFKEREPVVLDKGTISPFNTQNTIIRKQLFPLLYLPTYVTFRFTDILRGLVAQPILWLYNYQLGFTNATVLQKRNPHDYMKDFISELPMYQYCEQAVEIANTAITSNETITGNLYNVYEGLLKEGIVESRELKVLTTWLKEIS